jgi:hypothetical protein
MTVDEIFKDAANAEIFDEPPGFHLCVVFTGRIVLEP